MTADSTASALAASADLAAELEPFTHEAMEPAYRDLCEQLDLKTSQLFMAIRVAVTGKTATPPLFETMEILGRDRSVARLRSAALGVQASA
jgi:glutamyl-tRNA synthetase